MDEARMAEAIQQAQTGDPRAFGELYSSYARRVWGLCHKMLGPGPQVEEAVSEVFLKAHRSLHTFDVNRSFGPWVLSITSHHCLNLLRRRGLEQSSFISEVPREDQVSSATLSPLVALENEERRTQLGHAMEALPGKLRLPLVLRYQRELSYQEIARELGISANHVAVLLHRAKKALRLAMEDAT